MWCKQFLITRHKPFGNSNQHLQDLLEAVFYLYVKSYEIIYPSLNMTIPFLKPIYCTYAVK